MKETEKDLQYSYTYDPEATVLIFYYAGKPIGRFAGPFAEKQFGKLICSGVDIKITNMNSQVTHKAKVKKLRAIWFRLGIDHHRESILSAYSVSSTSDLNNEQLDELINYYSGQVDEASTTIRRLRSDILSILQRLGIYKDNSDWKAVNSYMLDSRISGKMLFEMTEEELKACRVKLNSILTKSEARKAEIRRQELLN